MAPRPAPSDPVSTIPGGTRLIVRVVPRARRAAIDGVRNGALVVRLAAPPVDGAANQALVALLADTLAMPRSAIRIAAGATARTKRLDLDGIAADDVRRRLGCGPA